MCTIHSKKLSYSYSENYLRMKNSKIEKFLASTVILVCIASNHINDKDRI